MRKKLRLQIQTQPLDLDTKCLPGIERNAQETLNQAQTVADVEIQNLKSDISLLENHVSQLLQKQEYETVV